MMRDALGLAIAALVAAALFHYSLSRVSRRLPRWLARRRGLPVGRDLPYRGAIAFGTLALEAALWLGALVYASERIPAAARARDMTLSMISASLRMPLFAIDGRSFSAIDLLALPLVLLAVWLGVGLAVRAVRMWLADVAGARHGLIETVSVLARYVLAAVGFLLVLQSWGVDVRSLAILASVLGVGLGFGLQNMANNFVSGLVMNVGRPIEPGDFVDVGAFSGTVRRIGARSTEILTTDEVTILIPNSRFLDQEVVNWSHGDPRSRVHVPVPVAYGSDVRLVRRLLLAAAAEHPGVLRDPRPAVWLHAFGASALEFQLLVWICDRRRLSDLVSELNFAIFDALRAHGIEIPFSQHDLHLRSPSLERALELWHAPDGAAKPAAPARVVPIVAAPALERGRPELWSDAELAAVVERLRGEGGVSVRDRRHRLTVFARCFVGREAVDWLVLHEGLSRAEATALGQRLLERGELRHVRDEHDFRDGHFFYRFRDAAVTSRPLAHLYSASNSQGESRERV
jgi:small-conductance mechanosensitive channel